MRVLSREGQRREKVSVKDARRLKDKATHLLMLNWDYECYSIGSLELSRGDIALTATGI